MKIYVASSWRNPSQPMIVRDLRGLGHEVYDYRQEGLQHDKRACFHWSEIDTEWKLWSPLEFRKALSHQRAEEGFRSDRCHLDWCDHGLLVLPCGASSHLEAGRIIGQGKTLNIYMETPVEPELMYKFADNIFISYRELISYYENHKED